MSNGIPKFIYEDVQTIKNLLGHCVVDVALFGSLLWKEYGDAGDVDLAISIRDLSLPTAKSKIERLSLSLPVRISRANGTYISPDLPSTQIKDYHIVLLDADHLNPTFMRLNKGKLKSFKHSSNQRVEPTPLVAA